MIEVAVSKRCSQCGIVKALPEYRIDGGMRDGYKHACKVCMNARDASKYADRKKRGLIRSRRVARVEPAWVVPTHTIQEGLASVQLRNWRGPVLHGQLRGAL